MSDSFEMIVDEEVTLAEAPGVCESVLSAFRSHRLIDGELSAECVLGGLGYRLGPGIPDIYTRALDEGKFWELRTSGIEPSIEASFNLWALGPSCQFFLCPKCNQKYDRLDEPVGDAIFDAVEQWHLDRDAAVIICPTCGKSSHLTNWETRPPLGFGNLAFRFWNWPPLDLPGWKLSIPSLVRSITGHRTVVTWGRI